MTSPSPQGWKVERLLDLVSIRSGQVDPKLAQYRRMPLIAPDHIESGTGRLLAVRSAREQGAISGKYLVDRGDIIYSKIRPYLMKAYRAEFPALCSADMYPLKPRKGADGRFVLNLLLGRDFTNFAVGESMRSGIPKINRVGLAGYELLVPPDDEQKMIGAALGDADGLIQTLEKTITKKRAIKQGMMQELLTGRTRLPGFRDGWREEKLSKVSTLKGRIGWQGLTQDEFTSNASEPFLVTGMNFKDGAIRWSEVYHVSEERYAVAPEIQLRSGDVLMTKDGTIGKLLFVDHIPSPGKATLNSHLLLFRPKGRAYDPRFLYYQLGSPRFAQHIELHKSGTTFFGISQGSVGKYDVLLPPMDEQVAIGRALADADAEIEALERRLDTTRAIKQGMMQELLTGRTRLVPIEASA